MVRKIRPDDLSEEELRRLLIEKRRGKRRRRIDNFRQSGRLVDLTPIPNTEPTEHLGGIDIEEPLELTKGEVRGKRRKQTIDKMLITVEVIAVLGLVFVLFNGVSLVQRLNEEITSALLQPTFSPTPLLRAVILPSGHTPPTDPGGARFNEAEIPEHLRPLHQSFVTLTLPTPSPEQAIQMTIPALSVDAPVVQGDGWEQLKQGIGQHLGTANPGQNGNAVFSAHNDVFGEIFRYLDQLQPGDEIIIHTNLRSYTYVIENDSQVVEPTFVQVMDSTGDASLTLISCYPYLVNSQRIVVKATLIDG